MKMLAVILAGGTGPKMWPRSTESRPKQFTHMNGDGTMLQNTFARISGIFHTNDIYVVTNEEYTSTVKEQIPSLSTENIISEPFGRNTAPALALTNLILEKKYEENTVVCVFPSDHIITNLGEFRESINTAVEFAYKRNGIVTLGIYPTRPETQYGYVQIDEEKRDLGQNYHMGIRYGINFAEKPDKGTALRFIESGDFLWNSGIIFYKINVFTEKLAKYLPDLHREFVNLKKHFATKNFNRELIVLYKKIDSISVDYGIMENSQNVFVVKSTFNWTDLEVWDELFRISMKDAKGNAIEGDVISINSKNCFISANEKMIGVVGIDDLIVIDTDKALLICKKNESEKVQEIVDYMKRKSINKYL